MYSYNREPKTLCFGEALMRLSPVNTERLEQTSVLEFFVEGAEAIAAIDLSYQGEQSAYLSVITDNRLGKRMLMTLSGAGVDTSRILRKPGRMGLLYFERGTGERISSVIYDRSDTPITQMKREDFDWDSLLNGIDSFYFSGVLPAINETLRLTIEDALIACKGRGIETCCDLNYRSRMWNRAVAFDTWKRLLPYIDICVGSDEDIWSLFPKPGINPDRTTTLGFLDFYRDVAYEIADVYACSTVAVQMRSLASNGIGRWRGLIVKDGECQLSPSREIVTNEHSGCGDAFAASILHGIHQGWKPTSIISYALTASALKATIPGSINYLSSEEIISAVGSNLSIVDY